MTKVNLYPSAAALLVIDPQPWVIRHLQPEHGTQFVQNVIDAGRALKPFMTVIRVVIDKSFGRYSRFLTGGEITARRAEYGIDRVPLNEDRVFAKGFPSALQPEMANYLRSTGTKALVLCGANTTECVAATLHDGLLQGFDCCVISDALGDHGQPTGTAADWHEAALNGHIRRYLPQRLRALKFCSGNSIPIAVQELR